MKKNIFTIVFVLYILFLVGYATYYSVSSFEDKYLMIGIISLITIANLVLFFIFRKTEKKYNWANSKLETLTNVIYQTEKSTELLVNNIPYGIASLTGNFIVSWCNDKFLEFFNFSEHKETGLSSYCADLETLLRDGNAEFDLTFNDKHFRVYYDSEFNTIALYDITNEFLIRKQYNDSRLAIGILKFDLLEEILSSGDVIEQNEIQNDYFIVVTEYFVSRNVYIQNVSNSTFMFVMKRHQLEEIIEDELSILKTVKLESNKLRVTVTLSLGIACYDEDYNSLHQRAKEALVLAEQRGGDQAIVDIEGEEIKYFGGTKEAGEKRSRIRSRIVSGRISAEIEKSKDIYVVTHGMADTDAVGALIGLNAIVKSHGKNAKIVYDAKQVDETAIKFINEIDSFNKDVISFAEAKNSIDRDSLVFVVDCNGEQQVMLKDFVGKTERLIIIDHHRRSKDTYKNALIEYIEPYASSTTELITELTRFQANDFVISLEEATLMYCGIVVDSNNFTSRTGSRTFDAASLLRSYGADIELVKQRLRDDYETVNLISKLTNSVEIFQGKYAFSSTESIISGVNVAKAANAILNIDKIEACFLIAKLKADVVKVSARSLGNVNVQLIMEKIGGGGHFSQSAVTMEGKTIAEVEEMIKEILLNM